MSSLHKKRRVYLLSALLLVLIYLVAGTYPFKLALLPFGQLDNGALLTPETGLNFPSPGIAYTKQGPAWLSHAIAVHNRRLVHIGYDFAHIIRVLFYSIQVRQQTRRENMRIIKPRRMLRARQPAAKTAGRSPLRRGASSVSVTA